MSFCASCGRQRNGTKRFCADCGAEFTDSPVTPEDPPTHENAPAREDPPARKDPPAREDPVARDDQRDATRFDRPVDATRTDPVAGAAHAEQPDPFASWFKPEGPARAAGPAGNHDGAAWHPPTQTVHAAQPTGYAAPPPSPPPFAQPAQLGQPGSYGPSGPQRRPPRSGRKGLFTTLAVILVLAAGGGAYAVATKLGKHSTTGPTQPATGPSSPLRASQGGTTAPASTAPSGPVSGSASSAGSPTPSPSPSLVSIAPGVGPSAAEPQVETLLSHYFHGINNRDYAEYASTLTPAELAAQPQSKFDSGYSSTVDSGMTLTRLSDNGAGGLTATVTFTSRQSPSQSVDKSACNAWTLNFYLVRQGPGYLIGPAPSGYQPNYSDC